MEWALIIWIAIGHVEWLRLMPGRSFADEIAGAWCLLADRADRHAC